MLTKDGDGGVPVNFDDVELQSIALKAPLTRSLAKQDGGWLGNGEVENKIVQTSHGEIQVSIKGDLTTKPVIVAYHDLGLNGISNFQTYFNYADTAEILDQFGLVCINAPGQEEGAPTWPDDKVYPTMDDLAEAISEVLNCLSVVKYIGS